jgi:TolA-binding protein
MTLPRSLCVVASFLAFVPGVAAAMTCEEIASMVTMNVPTNIVVEAVKGSGTVFTAADVQCLTSKNVPAEVVAQAKAMSSRPATTGGTSATRDPVEEDPGSSFDSQETIGGGDFASGPADSGPDTAEAEEEPGGGGPPEVEAAIAEYRAKKYQTASEALYGMLRDARYPDDESKIMYYLGKSLYDMQMYQSAKHYFLEVVRKGPSNPYFKYALPRLVAIADYTGNDYELLLIVLKLPPESFPRQARNHLNYLMGRRLFDQKELTAAAEYFAQVSSKSELYMRAKYYEGIIAQQKGRLRSAVMAFREVTSAKPPVVSEASTARELDDMKDLATINIARIYYGLERYDNADSYYQMVDEDSTYWPESLFERAWANFLGSRLNISLGLLLTVDSPYFVDTDFIPEVTYLRALTFFNLCEYSDVDRILTDFEAKYQPMQAELEAFLTLYKDQKDILDQAYDAYFTQDNGESALPPAAFARILRNRDLQAMVRALDDIDSEIELINAQKVSWKDSVGAELLRNLEQDRVKYKKNAGKVMLREMVKINDMLEDLLVRSEIVRFEVVDAQRADYEYRSGTEDVDAGKEAPVDFSTDRNFIYWPFNGEFWRDELGYYRYTEHGSCR